MQQAKTDQISLKSFLIWIWVELDVLRSYLVFYEQIGAGWLAGWSTISGLGSVKDNEYMQLITVISNEVGSRPFIVLFLYLLINFLARVTVDQILPFATLFFHASTDQLIPTWLGTNLLNYNQVRFGLVVFFLIF